VGGAARFVTAINEMEAKMAKENIECVVMFSGDIFSPSIESMLRKGEHMVPVLQLTHTRLATVGNHDFDLGVPCLRNLCASTRDTTWISSNLDIEGGQGLFEKWVDYTTPKGVRMLVLGIAEQWIDTLGSITEDEVVYND